MYRYVLHVHIHGHDTNTHVSVQCWQKTREWGAGEWCSNRVQLHPLAAVAFVNARPGTAAMLMQTRSAYTTASPRKSRQAVMPRRATYPGGSAGRSAQAGRAESPVPSSACASSSLAPDIALRAQGEFDAAASEGRGRRLTTASRFAMQAVFAGEFSTTCFFFKFKSVY